MTTPQLTIVGSPTPGFSKLTVTYSITFSAFDQASGQPYLERIDIVGDDTNLDDLHAGIFAFEDQVLHSVNVGTIHAPVAVQARSHVITLPNAKLNEDTAAAANPDEIRAKVTLTPIFPAVVGPAESNLVALQLP
jgi:hypothetical protein